MGVKRSHDGADKPQSSSSLSSTMPTSATSTAPAAAAASASPFMPIFESCRGELDTHHDRRERVIKASRDITAASKKIIFALQRVRTIGQPIPERITASNQQYYAIIRDNFTRIAPDVQGLNAYRYSSQYSGGCQEFMEAVSFEHYLATGNLISYPESIEALRNLCAGEDKVPLTEEDYLWASTT